MLLALVGTDQVLHQSLLNKWMVKREELVCSSSQTLVNNDYKQTKGGIIRDWSSKKALKPSLQGEEKTSLQETLAL